MKMLGTLVSVRQALTLDSDVQSARKQCRAADGSVPLVAGNALLAGAQWRLGSSRGSAAEDGQNQWCASA